MPRFQCYRTEDSTIRWRLLGGNNRVLGVGLTAHAEHNAALVEIAAVQRVAAGAVFEVEHADTGQWWWRMRLVHDPVASSAQGFARRVDAGLAVGRFQLRAPGATIDPVVAVFQPGRRGRVVRRDIEPEEPRVIVIPPPPTVRRKHRRPDGDAQPTDFA